MTLKETVASELLKEEPSNTDKNTDSSINTETSDTVSTNTEAPTTDTETSEAKTETPTTDTNTESSETVSTNTETEAESTKTSETKTETKETPQKKEKKAKPPKKVKEHSDLYKNFLSEIEKLKDAEEKLNHTLTFMRSTISQKGSPHFRDFWTARKLCIDLFKENISPASRNLYWKEYRDLSKEAKQLKDFFDEQSAFAVEQIEIAIKSLENDLPTIPEKLLKLPKIQFPSLRTVSKENLSEYNSLQKELNLLNHFASQVNSMRKELIQTDMRIKQKNTFFQRLSKIGDHIFPRRKELINLVSKSFSSNISSFSEYFEENFSANRLPFELKDEIKSLQYLAKILTLDTQSFTSTRKNLSVYWDKIKVFEKEIRQEKSKQRSIFKQNELSLLKEIEEVQTLYKDKQISIAEANNKFDEILSNMRNSDLGRNEVFFLKDSVREARQPIVDEQKAEEQKRQQEKQEKNRLKREKIQSIKQSINGLKTQKTDLSLSDMSDQRLSIANEITQLKAISKAERSELERLLKPIADILVEKKEEALLSQSSDKKETLQHCYQILKERQQRRKDVKTSLETLRKSNKSSGLDFEEALKKDQLIKEEKTLLKKVDQSIIEIEQKIKTVEISSDS